jgi:hypothetical protein
MDFNGLDSRGCNEVSGVFGQLGRLCKEFLELKNIKRRKYRYLDLY